MFARRYFSGRAFAPRYFPPVAAAAVDVFGAVVGSDRRLHGAHAHAQPLGVALGSDRRLHGALGRDEPVPIG